MAKFLDSRFLPIFCRLSHRIYRNSFKSVLQLQQQQTHLSKCKARHLCSSPVLQKEKRNKISDEEDTPKKNAGDISEELATAAKEVAESLPGDPLQTQSQLLQRLQAHNVLSESQKTNAADAKPSLSIENLFAGMKVIKEKASYSGKEMKTDSQTPQMKRQMPKSIIHTESTKIFSAPGLKIFDKVTHPPPEPEKQSLWDEINEETLATTPLFPSNAFEEMAIWTKEGKYWTFPINNEAGWEEEINTGFHEHVFLEDLIADFPSKGPIRHFMELVITGLSMSPYLTVQQKKDHISWFKNYFEEKRHLLKEELALK
ncbi:28S ribosomal protein S31, mitochondrial isoform X2 [Octopus sinensis]|uniref:Small ribosomal subunit protein mS31 n=1 Tax=Octopus sinensis TaxID=2607531 RepID=A0A7E6FK37_9MOLL|nr:28S ribosomal protein S31, mitochondrial isoform X2 [Octopus sinensis]